MGGKNVTPRGREITANNQTTIIAMSGVVVVGICVLFFMAVQWLGPNADSLIARAFPSPTSTRLPSSTPAPTKIPAQNLTATQQAWVRPAQSPSLGSVDEARSAVDAGTNTLESFAYFYPDTPEINQPGDVYIYEIQLTESTPLVWSYGWCTITQEILVENFSHIDLEFTVNGTAASSGSFVVNDYERSDGGRCREHAALVNDWPPGQHILESRITFTQNINDGWDIYPAGTHIFRYFVTVE